MKNLLPLLFLLVVSCSTNEDKSENAESKKNEPNEESTKIEESESDETSSSNETVSKIDCIGEVNVFLNDPDQSGTNIRNAPNGKVIYKLVRTEENFEYFITCTESKEGWFKIQPEITSLESPVIIDSEECWIHGSVLGAGTRNYGNQVIEVYSDADKSKVVNKIKQEVALSFLDLCKNMVKVKWKDGNGKMQEGWIDVEWVCGNPLTTCS